MDNSTLRPIIKRQLLFVGATFGVGLVLTYFLGFYVGLAANIALFIALMFYIRWRQIRAPRSLGFSNEGAGGGYYGGSGVRLKYACLSCGAQVSGARCSRCGSNMKKPLF